MTIKDFWLVRPDGLPLRIKADSYSQVSNNSPAICDGDFYRVAWTWQIAQFRGHYGSQVFYQSGYAPFSVVIVQPGQTSFDGSTSSRARSYLQMSKPDGTPDQIYGYGGGSSYRNRPAKPGWIRYCRGKNNTTPDRSRSHPSEGYGAWDDGYDGSNYKCRAISDSSECASGGNCETIFKANDQVIFVHNECPDISETPPDNCSSCCRQLLPLLRRLKI